MDGILRRFRNHLDFEIVHSEHFFPPPPEKRIVGMWESALCGQKPHSDQQPYQDLASSPLNFPENDLVVVYSRPSGLEAPDAESSESTVIKRTNSHYHNVSQPERDLGTSVQTKVRAR